MRSSLRTAALVSLLAATSFSCGKGLEVTEATPTKLSARGGETLTLLGHGFEAGTKVRLGDQLIPAADVKLASSTELDITTPPLWAGPVILTVETPSGDSAALADLVDILPLDLHFVEAPSYALPVPTTATVAGAALGDFDGDGDPDLVTCVTGADCAMLRNDGRGNFTPAPNGKTTARFPSGLPATRTLAAADLDGDGDLDLILGLAAPADMMSPPAAPALVYRNDGKAFFTDVADAFPTDADGITAIAVADLNGDGRPDLILANDTPDDVPFRVYLNATKGSTLRFKAAPAGTVPSADWLVAALALVDVDGDGDLDLVLSTPGAADGVTCRILLKEKDGYHEAPDRLPSVSGASITAFAVGDLDGDGSMDIVAVGSGQDRLYLNDGTGHYFDATVGNFPLDASQGTSVALVDVDRDKHLDVVIGNNGAETRLYLNDGKGRFLDHTPDLPILDDSTVWVGVADVDGDADQDILILNATPGPARLYLSVEPPAHDTTP